MTMTSPVFADSEGLRRVLTRLHDSGDTSWRDDPEAAELMRFTMHRYGALAHKHGLEPADAAVAAFEVMRTRAVREADDPWAVVTRAVQITLISEARANGLLCSTSRARRAEVAVHHDALRFSDRETPVCDYHPAFHVPAEQDTLSLDDEKEADAEAWTNAFHAVDTAVEVFAVLGWPPDTARAGIEYICSRLIDAGSRSAAFESLRRDRRPRAILDVDQPSWIALLRAILGHHHRDRVHTDAGRGLLLRLVIGHQVDELIADDNVAEPIMAAAPVLVGGGHV